MSASTSKLASRLRVAMVEFKTKGALHRALKARCSNRRDMQKAAIYGGQPSYPCCDAWRGRYSAMPVNRPQAARDYWQMR